MIAILIIAIAMEVVGVVAPRSGRRGLGDASSLAPRLYRARGDLIPDSVLLTAAHDMRMPPPPPPPASLSEWDVERPQAGAASQSGSTASIVVDPQVLAAFQQYDTDHSGTISRAEAAEMIKTLGLPVTDGYIERSWDAYDIDASGSLSFTEFSAMMDEGIYRNALQSIKTPRTSVAQVQNKQRPSAEAEAHTAENPLAQPPRVAPRPAASSHTREAAKRESEADGDLETPAEALFSAVDIDRSGQISFHEFSTFWITRQMATTGRMDKALVDELDRVWRRFDMDQSGELDPHEFAKVLATISAQEWEQRYDVARARGYYINRSTGERREHRSDTDENVAAFLAKNGIQISQGPRRKPKLLPFSRSHSTLVQDVDDWEHEIAHSHLAFRVEDERALEAHRIGTDIMWSRCSWLTRACCCCVGDRSAKAFLAAKDGPPGFESYPGWLGVCDLGLFAVGLVPALVGFFGYGGDWQDWCCFAGLLFLPHYANDYFCYQAAVIVLVFKQVEAKLILAYNFGFCVLLSVLIGKDLRLLLVWSALFPGICLVTFSDACTFQARTTKRTLEVALITFAVPFLAILMLGLRNNLEDGWRISWLPTLPIRRDWSEEDAAAANEYTTNATLHAERSESIQGHMDTQNVLVQSLALLQTNLILLLKSVYNHFQNPETAMILQLKVKRTEVGADDYLHTLTTDEKQQVRKWRKEKRAADKAARYGSAPPLAAGARQSSPRRSAPQRAASQPSAVQRVENQVASGVRRVEKQMDKTVDIVFRDSLV